MKYLLIEDNEQLADAVKTRMQLDGHEVDHAGNLGEAITVTQENTYDLILLDIMLPDGDGREFLEHHRARQRDTPVIVLTARSQVSDRINMLDLGADDYVTKPFDHAELQARCRAVLRRKTSATSGSDGSSDNVLRFGNVEFDAVSGQVMVAGEKLLLRNRERRLLEVFINAPGQVFSKQKLVDRLFTYDDDVSENAIEVYIGRLRKHLEPANLSITTLRGLGYRLDHE